MVSIDIEKQTGKFRIRLYVIIAVLLLLTLAAAVYLSDYYPADETVLQYLDNSENVSVVSLKNMTVFQPRQSTGGPEGRIGLIFYPGGKVDEMAYAALLHDLAEQGITCVLVHMPFRLAVLRSQAADAVIASHPEVTAWYLGGHSLGGAMAAAYAARKPDLLEGVILLAAYAPADLSQTGLKLLSIYGSEDQVLNAERYQINRGYLPADSVERRIDGGNHAFFADYGEQADDGIARISRQEQQHLTITWILDFLGRRQDDN